MLAFSECDRQTLHPCARCALTRSKLDTIGRALVPQPEKALHVIDVRNGQRVVDAYIVTWSVHGERLTRIQLAVSLHP